MHGMVEVVRWANVVLGTVEFIWLMKRMGNRWLVFTYAEQMFMLVLSFFVFGVTEGSGEALYQDAPFAARPFIYLIGNLALLTALVVTRDIATRGIGSHQR